MYVGLAVKESIYRKSVYTHQLIDERLMSMRVELTGECAAVNLVVAYAPTEAKPNAELKEVFGKKLGHLVKQIPTKELLFVLIDANARTGKRMEGCDDGSVLGAYGRDELTITASDCCHWLQITSSLSRSRSLAHVRVGYHIRSTASTAVMTENG